MSRRTLALLLVLSIAATIWAASALFAESTLRHYTPLIEAIHNKSSARNQASIKTALDDYQHAIRIAPCHRLLYKNRLLVAAHNADVKLAAGELDASDAALDITHDTLVNYIACAPMDGKSWLDLAMVTVHREGFTANALAAFHRSAQVAPGESWLAEKRLLFALSFRPLLDAKAIAIARHDIAILQIAHPIRMNAVLKTTHLKTVAELMAIFN